MPTPADWSWKRSEVASAVAANVAFAGVVMAPRRSASRIRQIEFLNLTEKRILLIIVTTDGDVQNRVLVTEKAYSPSELVGAANYLNQNFAGLDFEQIRHRLSAEIQQLRDDIMPLATAFLKRFAGQANRSLKGFTQSAVDRLTGFDWPGNVRQLQNEIQRAVLLCEGEMIDGADLSITRTRPEGVESQDTNDLSESSVLCFDKPRTGSSSVLNCSSRSRRSFSCGEIAGTSNHSRWISLSDRKKVRSLIDRS